MDKQELPSYFCRPELETFFGGSDTLPVVTFSPNDSFESIKPSLLKHLDSSNEYISIRVPIKIDSSKKTVYIKTTNQNPFAHIPIVCYNRRNILRIYLDNDSITINNENKIPYDSLNKLITANILNYGRNMYLSGSPNKMVVILKWNVQIKTEVFNLALKSIIDGHIKALNITSSKYFNKHLCSITKSDLDRIMSSFRFNLILAFPGIPREYLIFPSIG
ncbi:MAG: hypothetical protein ACO1PI_02295 [Bacteroidota bacterium]